MRRDAEVVREFLAALATGDLDTVTTLVDERLVFELGGSSRFAGRHEGRGRFFALKRALASTMGINNEIVAIHDIDGGAIVHQRGRGRDGYEDEALLLFTVMDGRVVAVKEFLFDHGPLEALAPRHDGTSL